MANPKAEVEPQPFQNPNPHSLVITLAAVNTHPTNNGMGIEIVPWMETEAEAVDGGGGGMN